MTALEFVARLTAMLSNLNRDEIADCEVYAADEDGDWKCPNISIENGDICIYG